MNKIEVVLPEDAENLTVYYKKVAEREAFDIADAKELLQQPITDSNFVNAGRESTVQLENIENGIYQIYISGDEEYEFEPMLVSMPAWETEEAEKPSYEVCVTPKYTKFIKQDPEPEQITLIETPIPNSPQTGDGNQNVVFGLLGIISFIIVVIMTCHNRFKCARMTE